MKNHKGSILVFALIVMSFILIAAFSVASVTLVERRSANVSVNSSTAFQNADKGMEEFLQKIYKEMNQNDTLGDLGDELASLYGDSTYKCDESDPTPMPARIGDETTEFIISAYKESTPDPSDPAGWQSASLEPIESCDAALADVARFKVAGNYNNAARAVFVKLRDSLTRGLVAHWGFEDRAQNSRITADDDEKVSFVAQDTSKQGHILTLCKINSDPSDLPFDVTIDAESGDTLEFDEFAGCSAVDDDGTDSMMPQKNGSCSECDANGAWTDGIVEEVLTTAGVFGNDAKEALLFDGADYLMTHVTSGCDYDTTLNCTKNSDDKLEDISDGIAISLWVKTSATDAVLVSRYNDSDEGYELTIESRQICFHLNNQKACHNENIDDDEWHHVVAHWYDQGAGASDINIFVDGVKRVGGTSGALSGDIDVPTNHELIIGGSDHDDDGTIDVSSFFIGTIDDVRIWNRALSNGEVWRLCTEAETGDGVNHDGGDHPAGCPTISTP